MLLVYSPLLTLKEFLFHSVFHRARLPDYVMVGRYA